MTTVKKIYDSIDEFAPFSIQDSFDNSGLLVGNENDEVDKTAVCLDITNEVIEEAHTSGAQLIVSHHPVIFDPLKKLKSNNPVYLLAKYGISAICAHTNIDMCTGGISDIMLELLGFSSNETLDIIYPQINAGYGRIVDLSETVSVGELAKKAKKAFNVSCVRYNDIDTPVKRFAVCSGAGTSEIGVALAKNCQAIITGDIKWSGFVSGANCGICVIDAGHFHTENIVCGLLKKLVEKECSHCYVSPCSRDLCSYI